MKLKTLKDFDTLILRKGTDTIPSEVVKAFKRDLRQEAIKWIKELQSVTIYPYGIDIPIIKNNHRSAKFLTSKDWINHFFNITEEDLK